MTIADFIMQNMFFVAIAIVILFLIIRYLYIKGSFDKFGIKDIKFVEQTNNDFFKTEDMIKDLTKEDFFATGSETKKIGDDNYFETDLNNKKWFDEKK